MQPPCCRPPARLPLPSSDRSTGRGLEDLRPPVSALLWCARAWSWPPADAAPACSPWTVIIQIGPSWCLLHLGVSYNLGFKQARYARLIGSIKQTDGCQLEPGDQNDRWRTP